MLKNAAYLALLIVMQYGTGGCATVAVWRWACYDRVSPREVTGLVVPERSGSRCIVIAYGSVEIESTLLVPINEYGKPAAPYAYLGGSNDDFWRNLTAGQYAWKEYYNPAIRLGTVMPNSKPAASQSSQKSLWISEGEVAAIGYRIDSENRIALLSVPDARGDPTHSYVLLVPSSYPRLNNSRAPAAVLATPFALAVDAVMTPILLPVAILFVLGTHGGAI
jgi:hypothetical protein